LDCEVFYRKIFCLIVMSDNFENDFEDEFEDDPGDDVEDDDDNVSSDETDD